MDKELPTRPPSDQAKIEPSFPFLKLPVKLQSAVISYTVLVADTLDHDMIPIDLLLTPMWKDHSCDWDAHRFKTGVEFTTGRIGDSLDEKHKCFEGVASVQYRAEIPSNLCAMLSIKKNGMFQACTETRTEALRIFYTSNHFRLKKTGGFWMDDTIKWVSSFPLVYLKMITPLSVNFGQFWRKHYEPIACVYGPNDYKSEIDEAFRFIQDTFSTDRLQLQPRFDGFSFYDMEVKLAATELIKVVLERASAFKVGTVSVMLRDTYFGEGYFAWH